MIAPPRQQSRGVYLARAVGTQWVFFSLPANASAVDRARHEGLKALAYTVTSAADLGTSESLALNGVLTDDPHELEGFVAAPTATIRFTPSRPRAGQTVGFHVTAAGPRKVVRAEWDLDDDGVVGDAAGPAITWPATPGTHRITVRVLDAAGRSSTRSTTVLVSP
jgi:hypothetical protein